MWQLIGNSEQFKTYQPYCLLVVSISCFISDY